LKKELLKNLLVSLVSAIVALVGNYYFIAKPNIEVDYIKIAAEILAKKEAPLYLKDYVIERMNEHSSVKIDNSTENINELLKNIPARVEYSENTTYGDITIELIVLKDWVSKIQAKCPECINKELFESEYQKVRQELKF